MTTPGTEKQTVEFMEHDDESPLEMSTPLDFLNRQIPDGIVHPDDHMFSEAVTTMTGQGTPELVVRPRSAQQVAAAVRYARDQHLALTVRAGGHSMAGLSTPDNGLLLDLRRMHEVAVEPATRLVQVGGGATWGEVATALKPHGLALTAGDTAAVGVGGLTLGGGIGWMVRRYGLAIDALVGAELVTADGSILQVSIQRHPEVFWALRGGGSRLGVVTRFDFKGQEVDDVVFGTVAFIPEDPQHLLRRWRDAQQDADERLTTTLSLMPTMGEHSAAAVLGLCFTGTETESTDVLRPFLELGTTITSEVSVRPYADVLETADSPPGMRLAVDNVLLPDLDDSALAQVAAAYASGSTVVSLRALGGAFSRVPADATSFAHRDAEAMIAVMRFSLGREAPSLQDLPGWPALTARGTGSYVNFSSSADAPALAAAYPATVTDRLSRLAAEMDPSGVFSKAPRRDPAAAASP